MSSTETGRSILRIAATDTRHQEPDRRLGEVFAEPIEHPAELPQGMIPKIIVLLSIGKRGGQIATFGGAQASIMKEIFVTEGACFPPFHASSRYSDPVNPAGCMWDVTTDLLKTFTAKKLTAPGHVVLSFETVCTGVVAFFPEDRPGNTKVGHFCKFSHQEFEIVMVKGQIGVQISYDFEIQALDYAITCIETMGFSSKASVPMSRHIQPFDPRVPACIAVYKFGVASSEPSFTITHLSGSTVWATTD